MSALERIYDKSPIFLQNLMCSVKGYINKRNRYGKGYREYKKFLEKFDAWSLEQKLMYQKEEMIKFINYVYNNSAFYHDLYKDIDITKIRTIDDLKKLPIVDKEILRQNINKVLIKTKEKMLEGHTGGTTGKSLAVRNPVSDERKRMAMLDHFKERVGFVNLKMKRATFNGKHIVPPNQKSKIFWRYNISCKQMIFSTFNITEENMKYYIKKLNSFKPMALDGFFTSMCEIASYIERHNVKLEFTPIAIFPTSETLTSEGRELLERVFKTKVYDQYASSEGAPFITECVKQVKHVELASGVFENIEGSDEVLVTSFTTHGTPLIRYKIGDRIVFDKAKMQCQCGMETPIVTSIEGRRLDFLYTAEGAKINAGNISNIFKNVPNAIVKTQLIQKEKSKVTILLVVDKVLYKNEFDKLIVEEFNHKFGKNTLVEIIHVDDIPRENSGKFRQIKNEVKE